MTEIDLEILKVTDTQVKVSDGDAVVWLPKSQLHGQVEDDQVGQTLTVNVPVWLAKNEGLI